MPRHDGNTRRLTKSERRRRRQAASRLANLQATRKRNRQRSDEGRAA